MPFYQTETFDARKLKWLIDNKDELIEKFISADANDEWRQSYNEQFDRLKIYLSNSMPTDIANIGQFKVSYYQCNNQGRHFAKSALGLQPFKREIRQTIAVDYVDIDISNCHPVILYHMCKEDNIECDKLLDYICNRDKRLAEIDEANKCGTDKAKQIYLSLINGGKYDYNNLVKKPDSLQLFNLEYQTILEHFTSGKYGGEFERFKNENPDKQNPKGSFINRKFCNTENKMLELLFEYFGKPKNAVLCFDGIMLNKNKNYDLRGAEEFIKNNTGIEITLKQKPFDNAIDVPDTPDYQFESLKWFSNYTKLISANGELRTKDIIDTWIKNCIVYISNGGDSYYLTLDKQTDDDDVSVKFKMMQPKMLYEMLQVNCLIMNPNYDEEFANLHKGLKNKERKLIPDFNKKFNKLLYNTIGDYIENETYYGRIKTYSRYNYYPYFANAQNDEFFNIFFGFEQNNQPSNTMEVGNSQWFKHMLTDFCNGDVMEFNHLLDHIADIIQDPANPKGSSHLFYSKQGTGKTLLGDWMRDMLGSNNVVSIVRTDRYLNNTFNSQFQAKLLKLFEEVAEKGAAHTMSNILKGEITAKTEFVERKGREPVEIRNCARFWFFTNNENALYVEADNRRYTLHKVSNEHANNLAYFTPIIEELKNRQFIKACFDFFAKRKYNPQNVRSVYVNTYQVAQKLANLSSGIRFIKSYVEERFGNLDLHTENFDEKELDNMVYRVKFQDLVNQFNEFGKAATLKTQLEHIGLNPIRMRPGKGQPGVMCVVLYPPDVEKRIREHIKDDKFKFDYGKIVGV